MSSSGTTIEPTIRRTTYPEERCGETPPFSLESLWSRQYCMIVAHEKVRRPMPEKTKIPLPVTGGCQCGQVRYRVSEAPLTLYVCHCTECQRQSTAGFSMSMPVPRAGFMITEGQPQTWTRTADSGRTVACAFCPHCGTRVFHAPTRNPAVVNVKPGTLDNTRWLKPVGHLWTRSAQPWVIIPPDVIVFTAQPSDFSPLYTAWAEQWE